MVVEGRAERSVKAGGRINWWRQAVYAAKEGVTQTHRAMMAAGALVML